MGSGDFRRWLTVRYRPICRARRLPLRRPYCASRLRLYANALRVPTRDGGGHGARRSNGNSRQTRHSQRRPDAVGSAGAADPRRRRRRGGRRTDHGGGPAEGPRHGRRDDDRRRQRRRAGARADRQPRASGRRRLDAAPEPAQLDRILDARRRDDDDLGGRGAYARAPEGHRRPQGAGDRRAAHLFELPLGRREAARRRVGDRTGHGGERLRRTGQGRRQAPGRDRAGQRQGRADRAQDGRMGAQARIPAGRRSPAPA